MGTHTDSTAFWLPDGIQVGCGVSEAWEAFVTSPATVPTGTAPALSPVRLSKLRRWEAITSRFANSVGASDGQLGA